MREIIIAFLMMLFFSADSLSVDAPKQTPQEQLAACQQNNASLSQYVVNLRQQRDALEEQVAILQQQVSAMTKSKESQNGAKAKTK